MEVRKRKSPTDETRKKISSTLTGRKRPDEARKNISLSLIGRKLSDEHKRKISESGKKCINSGRLKKGCIPWNKGKKYTEETRKKMSLYHQNISEESRQKMSLAQRGEKSHLWKGGITFKPYSLDWTRSLRISIRERDHYTCQICGEKQGDRAFSVHHIDYNKDNCNPDNLITLCGNCHSKTNHERDYWVKYFNK